MRDAPISREGILAAVERAERRARGEDPFAKRPEPTKPLKPVRKGRGPKTVTLPLADYKRLVEASECDDMIARCELCGAWIARDEPAYAAADDYVGCVYAVTGRESDKPRCVGYRALLEEAKS